MKFVKLKPITIKGHPTKALIDPDGNENLGFSQYRDLLLKQSKKYKPNTVDTYLSGVAHFFDYLYALGFACSEETLTEDLISDAIDTWDDYLVDGERSEDEIVIAACAYAPSPRVGQSTSANYHSGLKNFLKASEKINKAIVRLTEYELLKDSPLQSKNSLLAIPARESIKPAQYMQLMSKTMLAGVIRGGPKLCSPSLFPVVSYGNDHRKYKDFEFDKIPALLRAMPNARDKALYAFIAASGCRLHEALRILVTDINLKERTVELIDPTDRINDGDYDSFTAAQRRIIRTWKGRKHEITFLMEPFKSLFFKYASEYWNTERPQDIDHSFFFCCADVNNYGKPFLFAHPRSIRRGFDIAKRTVLETIPSRMGPHSLRHTYGYYMTNFCPRADGGYGLDIETVQVLMGHADPASTKKYSRADEERALLQISYANALVYSPDNLKTINEMRKDMLLSELDRCQKAINATNKTKLIIHNNNKPGESA